MKLNTKLYIYEIQRQKWILSGLARVTDLITVRSDGCLDVKNSKLDKIEKGNRYSFVKKIDFLRRTFCEKVYKWP